MLMERWVHDADIDLPRWSMLNRIGATPFLLAAKSVDVPLLRLLLEHGADPKLTTEDGTTALMA